MEQIKKELSVGTIITDGQYILGCRPYGRKDKEHSYDLPKGHWEDGETYLETAVRECKEETNFDLWPDHLVDLGKYEYIPTKDLYIFLVALDFMPELSTLKCTTYFEMDGKKVPEVVSYKLIPITELQWFFKSLEPIVKKALETFDSNIEEDAEAIVALPDAFSDDAQLNEKTYDTRGTGLREEVVTPIIYRDIEACRRYVSRGEAVVSTPGPSIIEHIHEHQQQLGVKLGQLRYVERYDEVIKEQQAELARYPQLAKGIHLYSGDLFALLEHLKSKKIDIGFIDFDGTDSSYLTTQTISTLASYSKCFFLAGTTRGLNFVRRGRPNSKLMTYPGGGAQNPIRTKVKPRYVQWLDTLYRNGYKFSATTWLNNSDPEHGRGAPMLGLLFCPSLHQCSFKLVLKATTANESFKVHDYSFETKDFPTLRR